MCLGHIKSEVSKQRNTLTLLAFSSCPLNDLSPTHGMVPPVFRVHHPPWFTSLRTSSQTYSEVCPLPLPAAIFRPFTFTGLTVTASVSDVPVLSTQIASQSLSYSVTAAHSTQHRVCLLPSLHPLLSDLFVSKSSLALFRTLCSPPLEQCSAHSHQYTMREVWGNLIAYTHSGV